MRTGHSWLTWPDLGEVPVQGAGRVAAAARV